jgi:hypothetical protein
VVLEGNGACELPTVSPQCAFSVLVNGTPTGL